MNITSAQYIQNLSGNNINVKATIDGQEMFVHMDNNNRHYAEIPKQVAEKKLTIKDAD